MYAFDEIKKADSEIADAIQAEMERQNSHLELIASENWVSKAVMAAMGSPLTNKYAEGYPGKRYYGGCQCVDVVEDLARERAKKLFGCDYANVQPHSGAQANLAVFFAMLEPGDKVMGMNLDHGGHLTHGSPVNISGKYFNIVSYGVNDEGVIDYDKVREIAVKEKPIAMIQPTEKDGGLCELHDLGLKPTEGVLASCKVVEEDDIPTYETSVLRAVAHEWVKVENFGNVMKVVFKFLHENERRK